MMIVQFVMECLCYLFLPIASRLFAFDSTKGLAIRYVQQTLAILAWPIGFAVVDLVGYSLLTSVTSVVSAGAIGGGTGHQVHAGQPGHRRHCRRLAHSRESRDAHCHADALLLGNADVIGSRPRHSNGPWLCGRQPLPANRRRGGGAAAPAPIRRRLEWFGSFESASECSADVRRLPYSPTGPLAPSSGSVGSFVAASELVPTV